MKKVLIVFGVLAISLPFAYYFLKPTAENEEKKDTPMVVPNISFEFTNQYGDTISADSLKGKIMVAEYFFTTCPTICPIMNDQMQKVQKAIKNRSDVVIMSFTVDPEKDTVEQLYRYAENHGAIRGKWHFLTGDKKKLYDFARNSLYILRPEEAKNQADDGHDFIHTQYFVLVDKKLQIKGYYDGTDPREVEQLIYYIKNMK